MNRSDILRMARVAGLNPLQASTMFGAATAIERFAGMVMAAERRACKQTCVAVAEAGDYNFDFERGANACADAIGKRGAP